VFFTGELLVFSAAVFLPALLLQEQSANNLQIKFRGTKSATTNCTIKVGNLFQGTMGISINESLYSTANAWDMSVFQINLA